MWPLAHQFSSCSHVGQQYTNSGPMLHNHASCLCIHFDWVTTKAQGNNKWLLRNHYRNSHQKGKDWLFTQKMWLWQMTRADPTWKMLLALPPPKTAWEKEEEEEERGRHNSRFLRVCRQRSGANTAAFRLPDAPISKSPETLVKTRSSARLHKIYRALTLHLSAYSTPKHPQRGTFATCYQPHSYSCSNSEPTWNAPSLKAQIQRPAPAPNVPTELTITVKQHASYSSEVFAFLLLEGKCTARRDKIIKKIYSSPHLEPCSAKLTQFQPPQFLSTNLRLNNKLTSGG